MQRPGDKWPDNLSDTISGRHRRDHIEFYPLIQPSGFRERPLAALFVPAMGLTPPGPTLASFKNAPGVFVLRPVLDAPLRFRPCS